MSGGGVATVGGDQCIFRVPILLPPTAFAGSRAAHVLAAIFTTVFFFVLFLTYSSAHGAVQERVTSHF